MRVVEQPYGRRSLQALRAMRVLLVFIIIDCYSLNRTLEIHGAANTTQIQEVIAL